MGGVIQYFLKRGMEMCDREGCNLYFIIFIHSIAIEYLLTSSSFDIHLHPHDWHFTGLELRYPWLSFIHCNAEHKILHIIISDIHHPASLGG